MKLETGRPDVDRRDLNTIHRGFFYLTRLDLYQEQKPYVVNFPVTDADFKRTNLSHKLHEDIPLCDVRGHEDRFCLDTHGFQMLKHSSKMPNEDFENDAIIRSTYYPEIETLIKNALGASKVFIFEHTPRLHVPYKQGCGCDRKRRPLISAHIDQTKEASIQRVQYHMGSEAEELLKNRFQVVNVWRPLFGPLRDFPLTLGDARSFDLDRDGEATDLVFPHYVGESINLYHHPDHKWYYISDQMRDEVWLFKNYDSKQGVAPAAPHCSFDLQEGKYIERPRESIEIRALVFF
ncbi:hypothetical protein BKA56DRAFT_592590 [Ilyonectria sp. MPI-CAGE-AT-0026]|nr:hypothetical protein BKA56DRAFT_592590 [Ilyonectria sp. MPI-CAGE-AT-0026]